MNKLINLLLVGLKRKNKLKYLREVIQIYIFILITINKLRRYPLLPKYYLSKQFQMNSWSLNQCKNYAKDFNAIYYQSDFTDKFKRLLDGFDEQSTAEMKFILMRMMFLAFLNRESMFSDTETDVLERQLKNIEAIKKEGAYYCFLGYKFVNNNMTIHNFYDDLGLQKIKDIPFSRKRDIIDIGAYVGDSSLILSKYTENNVYAFEPFDDAYSELQQNIALNIKTNIIPLKLGVSDSVGKKKLFFGDDALSISTNDPEKSLSKGVCTKIVEIETTTIDHFTRENNLDIGVIKIDAEGSEQAVLQGGIETIKNHKPILLISIYHNIDDFFSIKPWIDSLQLGYRYKLSKPEATTFIEETMLICYLEN